jgi:hypothetical protein
MVRWYWACLRRPSSLVQTPLEAKRFCLVGWLSKMLGITKFLKINRKFREYSKTKFSTSRKCRVIHGVFYSTFLKISRLPDKIFRNGFLGCRGDNLGQLSKKFLNLYTLKNCNLMYKIYFKNLNTS